jgi:hypothetical protein
MNRSVPPTQGQTPKVLPFPQRREPRPSSPFDKLTAALVLKRHREGTLDHAVVEALLAGVGLHP